MSSDLVERLEEELAGPYYKPACLRERKLAMLKCARLIRKAREMMLDGISKAREISERLAAEEAATREPNAEPIVGSSD
jgi:hypothetical protein